MNIKNLALVLLVFTTGGVNAVEPATSTKIKKSVSFKPDNELTETWYFEIKKPEPIFPKNSTLPNLNDDIRSKLTYKGEDLEKQWESLQSEFESILAFCSSSRYGMIELVKQRTFNNEDQKQLMIQAIDFLQAPVK